jgi:hypothetical protein
MTDAVTVILKPQRVAEGSMGWGVKDELTTSPDASFDHHELSMTDAVTVILKPQRVAEGSMGWGKRRINPCPPF